LPAITTDRAEAPGLTGFAVFDTAIGRCGIAWSDETIVRTSLPAASEDDVRGRFEPFDEASPPPFVEVAIKAIRELLDGEQRDLSSIDLDMSGIEPFDLSVYAAARDIPCGETRTYGAIAAAVGQPRAAQAVGRALGRNPFPIIVPCHRVLGASGRSGGFSAPGGRATKLKLLAIEGARRDGEQILFERLAWSMAPERA
jgi:methylated-DNA-[protein]-cysteine S-methyltransferase